MFVGNETNVDLGKAIEAGDDLIDALDDAFAEFGDEDFDFESSLEDDDHSSGRLGHNIDQSKPCSLNRPSVDSTPSHSHDQVPRTINAVDQIISPLQMPRNAKLFNAHAEPVHDSSTQSLCDLLESATMEEVVSDNDLITESDNTSLSCDGGVANKQLCPNEDEDSDVHRAEDAGSSCSSFDESTEFCRSLIDFSNSKKPLDPINEDDDFAEDSLEDQQSEVTIPEGEEEDISNIEIGENEIFLRKEETEIREDTIGSKEENCDEFGSNSDSRETYSEGAHRCIPTEREEEKKCELSDDVHRIASKVNDEASQSSHSHDVSSEPLEEGFEPPFSSKTDNLSIMRSSKLAQSNAEDVLDLSLEIQNLREQLKQSLKEKTKIQLHLDNESSKTAELEKELQQQRINFVEAKESYCVDVQELMIECQQARIRLRAAEEDAENALELAKSSDASRVEMEEYLQRSLDEIEKLRTEAQFLPRISEDNSADRIDDTNAKEKGIDYNKTFTSPRRRSNRQKAIVSVGRNLLRQVVDNDDGSITSTQDGSLGGSTIGSNSNSHYSALSRRSTDKRRRLIERLNQASDEFSPSRKGGVVVFSPNSNAGGLDLSYTGALSTTLKNIGQAIRQSGKTLGLGGRWFSKRSRFSKKSNGPHQEEMDIENMAKSYCKSTESLIMKQNLALKEMKSFCDYLEQKVTETS